MMTVVNVTIDHWKHSSRRESAPSSRVKPLDGVGGWVFTQGIEHTFEHRVIQMMQEVLL